MPAETIDHLLTYGGLSAITGVPVRTCRRWVAEGRGPKVIRLGRHVRFHPDDVRDWITGLRDQAPTPTDTV